MAKFLFCSRQRRRFAYPTPAREWSLRLRRISRSALSATITWQTPPSQRAFLKAEYSPCANETTAVWNSIQPTSVSRLKKRGACCWNHFSLRPWRRKDQRKSNQHLDFNISHSGGIEIEFQILC